jgi:hypothetical protein
LLVALQQAKQKAKEKAKQLNNLSKATKQSKQSN